MTPRVDAEDHIVELSRYSLELIRDDGEFTLYRAHSKQLEPPSILLQTPSSTRPSPETLEKIDHEFSLKDELDNTWAIRPVEISSFNDKRALVLEDPGGTPFNRVVEGPLEMTHFLRLAVRISHAVGQLHRRSLIHKDLKPPNIFVAPHAGRVWLTGFGIASRLPRERQPLEPPEFIAGTLAYMAPEQTGRMNRSIDSRSDLYALGVTFYEMLTGSLPFTASDPMEWVHCHIARQPVPPSERVKNVPCSVSAIVMKLLSKTAEERYQTASGAETDLRRCLTEWETQGHISEFPPGQHDTPDRVLIPEKLYGRASEIDVLLASFDRVVAGGRPELVLVSGYSGIGKSAVVNELHKSLVPPRGLFASGKFDEYKRDIAYATLAQAFQGLLRPLLGKSEGELAEWRNDLREALDPNGQLIVDLVPELKLIIGEQPPVPEVPPQDTQHRFQLVLRRFISMFARPQHPLALFLDDLQWLDAATLDLLEDLLTQPDVQHLLLIGAYRDNEVDPTHPLMRKVQAMRQAGAILQDIILAPLTREDLRQLVADALHCEPESASHLAQLIHDKTGGNPFFAIQFISSLVEEELLTFDHGGGRWFWDLNRIHARGYTDNVVELMVKKLNRLPMDTQKALQQLACLGNSAGFVILQMVSQNSAEEMHAHLWEAVRAGLVVRDEDSYGFLHDRVQEAAYSLIPEELRAETHLRIGRQLAAETPPDNRDERIFEIVNQLNRGTDLITSQAERERVAELNLLAGRRARMSTAYASALAYLRTGRALLSDQTWFEHYDLIFSIECLLAECELLTADMAAAEARLSQLVQRAKSNHDVAVVTRLRLTVYTALDRSDRGVEVCLEYLRRDGNTWPLHPTIDEVRREYDRVWSLVGNRQIEEFVGLPLMTNPEALDALDVLTEVVTPALFCDENLSSQVICRMVNLSLKHGNTDGSCFAYVWFAMIAGPRFGNYKDGFRFGRLGYELVEKRGLRRYRARTYMCFGSTVMPAAKHALEGRDLVRRAFDAAYGVGDLTFAAYSWNQLITNFLIVGDPLAEVQPEADKGLEFSRRARFGLAVDLITAQAQLIRTLRGLTPKFGSFNDEAFDECGFEEHLANNPVLAAVEFVYSALKVQARFLAMDYASAVDTSLRVQQLLWPTPALLESAEFRFYSALSHAASWDSASPDEKPLHFEALSAHHRQLEIWAAHCPENFDNRAALVGAEIARIEGRLLEAEQLYEKAILSAHTNGFVHNEAVANEAAARFYKTRGFEKIARAYLSDARYCYLRWGADGKVRQLDDLYPDLREEKLAVGPTSTIGTPVEHLELGTVIKVSHAVSSEMDVDKLIDILMRTAIEHAGAVRGLLILSRGDQQRIEAEATTSGERVMVRRREAAFQASPQSIINYVVRTQQCVILDDASSQNPFSADAYILHHHARSVLCLPLINQSKLIGVLYLENNLAPHVFTPTRIGILKLLASQAAISLENTRLYADLEQREAKIRRLVDANIMGVIMCNIEGEIVDANDAFLRMLGYKREDLVSGRMRWTDLTPAEWLQREARAIAELKRTGTVQPYEKEFFRKDGSRVPVLAGGALFEGDGSDGVAFVLDLSEQKRSEEGHRAVVETASDAVISADENGLILFTNHSTKRIFGYDSAELIGKALTTIMPEYMRKLHEAGFKRYLATGQRHINWQGTELIGMRKNGEEFPLEISFGEQIRNGHRVFTGFVRDISEKKRAEEALRRSESYLAQAQRIAHVGSWGWQIPGMNALYLSEEWYRIYGFDPEDGMPTSEQRLQRIHTDDRARYQAAVNRAIAEKSGYDVEFRILPPQATLRHIHSVGRPVLSPSGELVQFVGVAMDVTETRLAEAEHERLRQELAHLAHLNRVSTLGELTASLAHEIKQPIGATVTNAEACVRSLDRDQPDLSEAREAALEMVRDARRAADIIDRVRMLYQKGSSKLDVVDLNEVIGEMVILLHNEAKRHSVTIHTDLAEGLPKVKADRVQLQQALMNLMLNGIEAMRDTRGELSINARLAEDGQLLISVADTGVGLPTENADQIFNPFFTTKSQGTGLGLAITRSIIESHGGRIWATPNSGRGVTFHFTLPASVAVAA